jgi:hypothetical protein
MREGEGTYRGIKGAMAILQVQIYRRETEMREQISKSLLIMYGAGLNDGQQGLTQPSVSATDELNELIIRLREEIKKVENPYGIEHIGLSPKAIFEECRQKILKKVEEKEEHFAIFSPQIDKVIGICINEGRRDTEIEEPHCKFVPISKIQFETYGDGLGQWKQLNEIGIENPKEELK